MDCASRRRTSPQFFAVVSHGEITDHFKVLTPFGRSYTIKYAHLPHVVLEGSELMIIMPDVQVLITGRCLHVIEQHIAACGLRWVKASPSGKDDGQSDVFIDEIQVKGSIHELIGSLKHDEE